MNNKNITIKYCAQEEEEEKEEGGRSKWRRRKSWKANFVIFAKTILVFGEDKEDRIVYDVEDFEVCSQ